MTNSNFGHHSPEYREMGLLRLRSAPHVRRCPRCKLFLEMLRPVRHPEYLLIAKRQVHRHIETVPTPGFPACYETTCLHQERIPRETGLSLVRMAGPGTGGMNIEKRPNGALLTRLKLDLPLEELPEDALIEDEHRRAQYLHHGITAGHAKIWINSECGVLHILGNQNHVPLAELDLPGSSRWEGLQYVVPEGGPLDPHWIWSRLSHFERVLPEIQAGCLKRFGELRDVAELDLEFRRE